MKKYLFVFCVLLTACSKVGAPTIIRATELCADSKGLYNIVMIAGRAWANCNDMTSKEITSA